MIDTVRVVAHTSTPYEQLVKLGYHRTGFDYKNNRVVFDNANFNLNLGSYCKDISVLLDSTYPNSFVIQFSVPKILYGSNIFLSNFDDLRLACFFVHSYISNIGVIVEPIESWTVNRLDLCYAWRLLDNDHALQLLDFIKAFKFVRKQQIVYDTSLQYVGSSYSTKFYMKQKEFLTHDFGKIRELDRDEAYRLLGLSEGILRFEVTMRKQALKYNLGIDTIYIDDIISNSSQLQETMRKYFYKMFLGQVPKIDTTQQVFTKLVKKYGEEKARGAFLYYVSLTSSQASDRHYYKLLYNKRSIIRHRKALKEAGVGLIKGLDTSFNFDIPSENFVGFYNKNDLSACVVTQADR